MQNFSVIRLFAESVRVLPKTFKRWEKTTVCGKPNAPERRKEPKVPVPCQKPATAYDSRPEMRERGIQADPCDAAPRYTQPRVVIVGAGLAGLTAAARLTDNGITNYVVLEAYGRPGGRILSSWLGDVPIELGSAYPQDSCCAHPVFKLHSHEEPPLPGPPAVEHVRGLFNRYDTDPPSFPAIYTAYRKFRQIEAEAAHIFAIGNSKQHGSLQNFISLRIQQELHEFPVEHQHDAAKIMFGMCQILCSKSPVDTSMIVGEASGCYMSIPGGNVRVPLGVIGITAPIIQKINEGNIEYCKPVTCIYWGTNQKIGYRAVVRTADGEEYRADYVIITVSLGCLMNQAHTLFCPALPSTKMDAIRCLGFQHINKIYLEYARPFWYWQTTNLDLRFDPSQLCFRMDWTRDISRIRIVPNSKYVLLCTVVGESARMMEMYSDKDVAEGVTDVLQSVTGASIPYPTSIIRSRWSSDPFFLGGFAYDMYNSGGVIQRTLACPLPGPNEPVPPILLFAGEATVPDHCGTLRAARLSGIREAQRIINLTLQFKGPPLRDRPVTIEGNRNFQASCPCYYYYPPCPCPCDPEVRFKDP